MTPELEGGEGLLALQLCVGGCFLLICDAIGPGRLAAVDRWQHVVLCRSNCITSLPPSLCAVQEEPNPKGDGFG